MASHYSFAYYKICQDTRTIKRDFPGLWEVCQTAKTTAAKLKGSFDPMLNVNAIGDYINRRQTNQQTRYLREWKKILFSSLKPRKCKKLREEAGKNYIAKITTIKNRDYPRRISRLETYLSLSFFLERVYPQISTHRELLTI